MRSQQQEICNERERRFSPWPGTPSHGENRWRNLDRLAVRGILGQGSSGYEPHDHNFGYVPVDLGPIPDLELSAYPPLRAGFLVLKYSHRDCDYEAVLRRRCRHW